MLVVPKDKGLGPQPVLPSSAAESRSAGPGDRWIQEAAFRDALGFLWPGPHAENYELCAARLPLTSWPVPRVPWGWSVGKAADDIG